MTTVLIVDDHPEFRAMARLVLDAHGFEVVGEAADGEAALSAAGRLQPDVVLLDIGLPGRDGFDVAESLSGRVDVVLTSSRAAADYGGRVERAPAVGFLPKTSLSGSALRTLLAR